MTKKSISHDEASRQTYAANPMQAVEDVLELARQANELEDRVKKLEAENARLKKQCAHLANDVIAAAQDYGAPMSDCRSCDYARYCERRPGQIEPNWDMCEAAVLKSCEPENCE